MFITYCHCFFSVSFFFNDTATTEIYTLSLHDALPIYGGRRRRVPQRQREGELRPQGDGAQQVHRRHAQARRGRLDRKSTRLNSSHVEISYAVFCLKKKKKNKKQKKSKRIS